MVEISVLDGPRLKVERANRHIDELRVATQPLSHEFYEITFDRSPMFSNRNEPGIYVHYRPKQAIPSILALMLGDAIHNLRSALDHLSTAMVRTIKPGAKTYFPIAPKREIFEAAPVLDLIEKALPGGKKLILENIRPKNASNEVLWRFNDLDNDDKHNLIIPTVTIAKIEGLDALVGSNRATGNIICNDAARPFCVLALKGRESDITIQDNSKLTVDVKFGKRSVFENEPVIPTLTQIAGLVSHTLDEFETLIRNTP